MDANTLERIERAAVRDLFAAAPEGLAARLGIRWGEVGGALCMAVEAAPEDPWLNRALCVDAAAIPAVEAFYSDLGVDWRVAVPRGSPLERRLAERGYQPGYAWVKFGRGVEGTHAHSTLRIGPADAHFGSVVQRGFGMPPSTATWIDAVRDRPGWHCFMAWSHSEPAAAGALFVEDRAGWLGFGATLPDYRGRGAQKALLAKRIETAAAEGCELLATETGERLEGRPDASYRNILSAGFEPQYVRSNLRGPVN